MIRGLGPSELVSAYLEWLRSQITAERIGDAIEITTPFLDRHNDYLQIYVKQAEAGLLLTDDGNTIRDLESSGCDIKSQRRSSMLRLILNGFGVKHSEDELVVEATPANFPQRKHALLQAILAVNDMFMTAKRHVDQFFLEDVERFLRLHDVRFTPHIQFVGKTGFVHSFDFVVPASHQQPERIIKAINQPKRDSVTSLLFSWADTKQVRPPDSVAYAFLNDSERHPGSELRSALREYGVRDVLWHERERFAPELAA